ncbi:MAG TPA: CUAEP/CCAEP-tail radical SAM protein [Terriglobia bacterium]|nr:CUAEP/CCAEP-tail radical SAM protein [Terriglobia bacterium]
MRVVLVSTYELGRQPFGLASPAAWLRRAGHAVTCLDLSREALREEPVRQADFIAFYVPMHTATRLAVELLPTIRGLNPDAHLCFYGLYAPVNESYLRKLGAETILGGEFEDGLMAAVARVGQKDASVPANPQSEPVVSLGPQQFLVPERDGLPPLERYAHLNHPDGNPRIVGYTEASRGCKHLCRHCPIVPVYHGRFRIVRREIVLEDIRRQVEAGAEHITFGDPDFFNGIRHAVGVATAMHAKHPRLTYDVTIKIEHLLKHAEHLRTLRDTGCLFVTSAVEAVDDRVLARLEKGHSVADFVATVELFREIGLTLSPTFVAFTPWTTLESYLELLRRIAELDLIENVSPIQLAIRLLIPAGSRLLELDEVRQMVGGFDDASLAYPWANPDPRVDALSDQIQRLVERTQKNGDPREAVFERIWKLAHREARLPVEAIPQEEVGVARAAIPYLTEPWYC